MGSGGRGGGRRRKNAQVILPFWNGRIRGSFIVSDFRGPVGMTAECLQVRAEAAGARLGRGPGQARWGDPGHWHQGELRQTSPRGCGRTQNTRHRASTGHQESINTGGSGCQHAGSRRVRRRKVPGPPHIPKALGAEAGPPLAAPWAASRWV